MKSKVFEYARCSTCVKARKFLGEKSANFNFIPIIDQPPTAAEIKRMLTFIKEDGGTFKKLFNTSGQLYRELKIAEKLKNGMTEAEAVELLSKNGKLIKRPFLLSEHAGTVGFDPLKWKKFLK